MPSELALHSAACNLIAASCSHWLTSACSELLLGSDVGAMTALSLSAVGGLGGKSGVALSANHLFALVLSCESGEGGLDADGTSATSSKSEDQMEG